MTRDEEKEMVREFILMASTLREELPALRATMYQLKTATDNIGLTLEQIRDKLP